jgi:hypothetical protein
LITGQPPRHDVEAVLGGKGTAINIESLSDELNQMERQGFMHDQAGAAEVITRMCAPEPSERYTSLDEVLEDLAILDA